MALLDVKNEVLAEYDIWGKNGDNDDKLPVMNPADAGGLSKPILADSVEACCTIRAALVESAMRIAQRFTLWHMTSYHTKTVPSHRKFRVLLENHFQRFKNGTTYYRGIRLKEELHLRLPFS